jgi:hypothetical protein
MNNKINNYNINIDDIDNFENVKNLTEINIENIIKIENINITYENILEELQDKDLNQKKKYVNEQIFNKLFFNKKIKDYKLNQFNVPIIEKKIYINKYMFNEYVLLKKEYEDIIPYQPKDILRSFIVEIILRKEDNNNFYNILKNYIRYAKREIIEYYNKNLTEMHRIFKDNNLNWEFFDGVSFYDLFTMKKNSKYLAQLDTNYIKNYKKVLPILEKFKEDNTKKYIFIPYNKDKNNIDNYEINNKIFNNIYILSEKNGDIIEIIKKNKDFDDDDKTNIIYHLLRILNKYNEKAKTETEILTGDKVNKLERKNIDALKPDEINQIIEEREYEIRKNLDYQAKNNFNYHTCDDIKKEGFKIIKNLNNLGDFDKDINNQKLKDYLNDINNQRYKCVLTKMDYGNIKNDIENYNINNCHNHKFTIENDFDHRTNSLCKRLLYLFKDEIIKKNLKVFFEDKYNLKNITTEEKMGITDPLSNNKSMDSIKKLFNLNKIYEEYMPEWSHYVKNNNMKEAFEHRQLILGDVDVCFALQKCSSIFISDPFFRWYINIPKVSWSLDINKAVVSCFANSNNTFPIRIVKNIGKIENFPKINDLKEENLKLLGTLFIKVKPKRTFENIVRYYSVYFYYNLKNNSHKLLTLLDFRSSYINEGEIQKHVKALIVEMNSLLYSEDYMNIPVNFYRIKGTQQYLVSKYYISEIRDRYEYYNYTTKQIDEFIKNLEQVKINKLKFVDQYFDVEVIPFKTKNNNQILTNTFNSNQNKFKSKPVVKKGGYYQKYLKYKNKYLNLKKQLHL